ncbi:MAG: tetrahydrofolate synthase [Treponema sp.]|jgi:dihydrofolate synthase/folylpolyglutamate synthase|nr:tetrahydrofolate synthase [Treponema sp.]
MTPFTSSTQVFDWISHYINVEKGHTSVLGAVRTRFTLDAMKTLAALADHPETRTPVIHIAGSKGKGSVAAYSANMLEEAGFVCARYTSPHVTDWRERITLGNAFFDEAVYCDAGNELFSITGRYTALTGATAAPTFFELMTLYFFLCARRAQCDAMVVETGMGGRLDATNIVDPRVSAITLIEKEHTEYLGNTLALIAGEKAGIIKPDRPLALAEQHKEAYDVFVETCAEKGSRLYYLPVCAHAEHIRVSHHGTSFSLAFNGLPAPLDVSVPTPGVIQAYNAALAVLAVTIAFPQVDGVSITRGLAKSSLRSRFEKIWDDPVVVIDGAHTGASIAACADTWTALYGAGGVLLFGCAADKDAAAMASILFPRFSYIIITTPGTFKKSCPETVYAVFANLEKAEQKNAGKVRFMPETRSAIEQALSLGREKKAPVLAAGSFYLAGEIASYTMRGEAHTRRTLV